MNKRLVLLSLALCLALASAVTLQNAQSEFVKFQRKYQKVYESSEFQHRFNIFRSNLALAEVNQKKNPKAKFGVNQFSDLSQEEFAKYYLMPKRNPTANRLPVKTDFSKVLNTDNLTVPTPDPSNWDWFAQGYCTAVYNQGQCGSCWAFSAVETVESYYALSGGALTSLSMEQVVDCDTAGQDQGCNGGFPTGAYQYIESAGGLEAYSTYPYTAGGGSGGSCQSPITGIVTVTGYSSVSGETGLYQQLSTAGPVSICVDATTWQSYNGGVITTCTSNQIDHCIQLTGYANYGTSNAYWIVRNSWGTGWGEQGFIWVAIGQDLCEIGDDATIVSASSGITKA